MRLRTRVRVPRVGRWIARVRVDARNRTRSLVDSTRFDAAVVVAIALAAVVFGVEGAAHPADRYATWFDVIERVLVTAFGLEQVARIVGHGRRFARGGWNWFDLTIVKVAIVATWIDTAGIRWLSVLLVLRLISLRPKPRAVVEALLRAVWHSLAILGVLLVTYYTSAVLAEGWFHADSPEHFGTLGRSLVAMFRVMTLDGWEDLADEVLPTHPMAMAFFVAYIVLVAIMALSLLISAVAEAVLTVMRPDPAPPVPEPTSASRRGRRWLALAASVPVALLFLLV